MQLVAEKRVDDLPPPPPPLPMMTTTTPIQTAPPEISTDLRRQAAMLSGAIGALNVLSAVLAVRAILLLAVAGAVGLTLYALEIPDPMRLVALGVYNTTVVIPVVLLSFRR